MTEINPRNKEHYFDSIFNLVSEGIVAIDHGGIIFRINAAFTKILGYEEQEILGKPFYDLAYTLQEKKQITSYNPLHRFSCAEKASMEMILFDRQAHEVPVRFRSFLVKDAADTITEALGLIEHIVEQPGTVEAGSRLAEKMWVAQQNFENILNHSPDAIVINDISGNVMTANNAFLHLLNYTQEEVRGRHIVEFTACIKGVYATTTGDTLTIDEEYVNNTARYSAELFEKGYVNFETHFVKKDNVIVPVDITMSVLTDQEGQRRGSLVIARDMTKRTIAERELTAKAQDLQKTKEQLEQLIETSLDPIIIADSTGVFVKANKAFLDLIGLTESEVIGRTMYQFGPKEGTYESTTGEKIVIDEEFSAKALESITLLFEQGKLSNWSSYVLNKDNKLIPLNENAILLRNEAGDITASLAIIRDITEQRKAELGLIAAKEAAEAANSAKSAFLANMSHEIRTPLNGVIGFTDMLMDTVLNDEQKDCAGTIKRCGEALLSLINDILDFSKIEADHIRIEKIDFDIEMLAYDACEMVRPRLESREVELLCRIGSGVPAMVKGDPHRYRQVMVNLMGNAVKFTDAGEIELALDAEQEQDGRVLIHARVRDTGIGISHDKLEAVFEIFQQADSSTTRKYGGTGLGLSICRRIANLMGGHCWAESEPGRGSTFHFTAWLGQSELQQATQSTPVSLAGRRVIIADDNRTNLEILTRILKAAGMQVTGFSSGSRALEEIKRALVAGEPYDICVLDVGMPGMSGYEAAQAIRSLLGGSLPLLAFTSSTEAAADKCLACGFNGFLPKPIKRIKLYTMLERLMGEALHKEMAEKKPLPGIITQHWLRENEKRSASILLAEDNPVNQKLAVKLLSKGGYTVSVAGNGREAVEKFSADPEQYDIIFMDIQMPELNGLAAAQELRKKGFTNIPIVAMTANAMDGDKEKCLAAGMNDYIAKPIKREIVFEMLKKWIFERVVP